MQTFFNMQSFFFNMTVHNLVRDGEIKQDKIHWTRNSWDREWARDEKCVCTEKDREGVAVISGSEMMNFLLQLESHVVENIVEI